MVKVPREGASLWKMARRKHQVGSHLCLATSGAPQWAMIEPALPGHHGHREHLRADPEALRQVPHDAQNSCSVHHSDEVLIHTWLHGSEAEVEEVRKLSQSLAAARCSHTKSWGRGLIGRGLGSARR